MFDGFWIGVFGGLLGPTLVKWAAKYRYRVIFLLVTAGVHIYVIANDVLKVGFQGAWLRIKQFTFTPVGILAPFAVGLIAVVVVLFVSVVNGGGKDKPK